MGICEQLPKVFGSMDKVPAPVLEQCKRAEGAKTLAAASNPTDICKSLESVFGSLDKVPKEVQEKCKQAEVLGGLSSLASAAGGGAAGGAAPDPAKMLGALGQLTGQGPP